MFEMGEQFPLIDCVSPANSVVCVSVLERVPTAEAVVKSAETEDSNPD